MAQEIPYSAWIAIAFFWAICGFAVWKGGWEERIAGGALALGALATPIVKDHHWLGPQWGVFSIDLVYLALIVAIAMRTKRWWPLPAAAFQLLGVMTHAARIADHSVGGWAYITAGVIWSYALLITVAVGAFNHWRENTSLRGQAFPH